MINVQSIDSLILGESPPEKLRFIEEARSNGDWIDAENQPEDFDNVLHIVDCFYLAWNNGDTFSGRILCKGDRDLSNV